MAAIDINADKIYLSWSREEDGIPEGVENFTPTGISFKAMINYWPELKDHMRWSDYEQCYFMNFSMQNLGRLKRTFPNLRSRGGGKERLSHLRLVNEDFHKMVEKAERIKRLPLDKLPKYDYKVPPIGGFQHRGVVFLRNIKRVPLFMDCGLGKTYCVLVSTAMQIEKGEIKRGKTLIAAKLTTLETAWWDDAAKFTGMSVGVLWTDKTYKRKEKLLKVLNEDHDVYLINHDGLKVLEKELIEEKFEKVVVDESTMLKGYKGMSSRIRTGTLGRCLMRISQHADWRVIMSGTPAPNGPIDLWGQFNFLDPEGNILEPYCGDFYNTYFNKLYFGETNVINNGQVYKKGDKKGEPKYPNIPIGQPIRPDLPLGEPLNPNTPSKWIENPNCIQEVGRKIERLEYRVRAEDHGDIPPMNIFTRKVRMSDEQERHYNDMKEKLKIEIDGERITATMQLTKYAKLRQVTSGFVRDHNKVDHPMSKNPKIEMLDQLVEEEIGVTDHKIIIYGQYRWEIAMMEKRYKKYGAVSVYGGNKQKVNLANIKKFKVQDKCRIIILQPRSAAHGLTLTESHYLIFYSIDYSAEMNYQARKRIQRISQTQKCMVYYILCKDTIDEVIYQVLQVKNRKQAELIDRSYVKQDIAEKEILNEFKKAA